MNPNSLLSRIGRGLSRRIVQIFPGTSRFFAPRERPEQIFTAIYRKNSWGSRESVSGPGSTTDQTRLVTHLLPDLFRELGIQTILDLPCGDFNWIRGIDLSRIDYLGGDIVQEIVERNARLHQRDGIRFQRMNLLEDRLPQVDLVLCRDCLVHFSTDDVFRALENICASGSKYLLSTTFPDRRRNRAIFTGEWQPINLQIQPFLLPEPDPLINEGCTESGGRFTGKSLGLWSIPAVRQALDASRSSRS